MLSNELKAKIPVLFDNGYTAKCICTILGVKKSLVYQVLSRYAKSGIVYNPYTYSCATRRWCCLTRADEDFILAIVRHRRTIYLDELRQELHLKRHVQLSIPTLYRALQRLQISHKAVSASAAERNTELRAYYMNHIGMEAPDANMLVFIDEAAMDKRTSVRWYGWAPAGQHCHVQRPFVRGLRYSILPAITLDGIIVYDIIEGAVDGDRFLQFLRDQVVRSIFLLCVSACSHQPCRCLSPIHTLAHVVSSSWTTVAFTMVSGSMHWLKTCIVSCEMPMYTFFLLMAFQCASYSICLPTHRTTTRLNKLFPPSRLTCGAVAETPQ